MSKRITIEELQSYLWNSAVLLRTNIDAGAYKQYIFPLLFFKRICDVYDEETAAAIEEYGDDAAEFDEDEIHTFIVPKGYHWNDVRAVSENVGVAIPSRAGAGDIRRTELPLRSASSAAVNLSRSPGSAPAGSARTPAGCCGGKSTRKTWRREFRTSMSAAAAGRSL